MYQKILSSTTKIKKIPHVYLIYFSFLIYNLLLAFPMQYPIITDEYGALADAVYLSGRFDWTLAYSTSIQNYWGYGSTIWLVPFMWLFSGIESGRAIFKLMLIFNACFVSFIPVLSYKIVSLMKNVKEIYALCIAFCIGLFPAYTVMSKYAWGETALAVLPWLAVYLLGLCSLKNIKEKKRKIFSVLLGCVIAFAWSVHGRAAALILSVLLTVIMMKIFSKKWIISWIYIILPIIFGVFFDKVLKSDIISNLIMSDPASTRNTLSNILTRNISGVSFAKSVWQVIRATLGMSYYDLVITFGIGSVGIVSAICAIKYAFKKQFKNSINETSGELVLKVFPFVLFLSSLAMSVIFFLTAYLTESFQRREYFIYGRYTEAAAGMMMMVALYHILLSGNFTKFQKKISTGLSILILLWGTFITSDDLIKNGNKTLSYSMVSGIIPWGGKNFWKNTSLVSCVKIFLIILVIYFLVLWLVKRKYLKATILIISCFFIYSTGYSMVKFVWPSSQNAYRSTGELREFFGKVYDINEKYNEIYCIKEDGRVLTIQYTLPDFEVTFLNKSQNGYQTINDIKENSFIISDEKDIFSYILPNCMQIESSNSQHYIWAYGKELIEELEIRGIKFEDLHVTKEFSPQDLYCNEISKIEEDRVLLPNGGLSYGPYISLMPGYYDVTILGDNLDGCQLSLTADSGKKNIDFKIKKKTSDRVVLSININEITSSFEVLVNNESSNTASVAKLLVEYIDFVKVDLDKLEIPDRTYSVNDRYTRDLIENSEKSIRGQTDILFTMGDTVTVNNIYFLDSEYEIRIHGKDMQNISVWLQDESGIHVPLSSSDVNSVSDYITYKFPGNNVKRNLSLVIQGNEKILSKFSSVEIVVVNE